MIQLWRQGSLTKKNLPPQLMIRNPKTLKKLLKMMAIATLKILMMTMKKLSQKMIISGKKSKMNFSHMLKTSRSSSKSLTKWIKRKSLLRSMNLSKS